jgi:hypothetical protein
MYHVFSANHLIGTFFLMKKPAGGHAPSYRRSATGPEINADNSKTHNCLAVPGGMPKT